MIRLSGCMESFYKDLPNRGEDKKAGFCWRKAFAFWRCRDAVKSAPGESGMEIAAFDNSRGSMVDPSN